MAWIKCEKCDKRVSDKVKKCPKCGCNLKKRDSVSGRIIVIRRSIFIMVNIFLIGLTYVVGKDVLYSGYINTLVLLFGSCLVLLLGTFLTIKYVLDDLRGISRFLISLLVGCSLGVSLLYCYRGIIAFSQDNSIEVYNLTSKYDLKTAKKIRNEIDKIFEFNEGISIRNIEIATFYENSSEYVLYLDDSYGNYRLKFFVEMDEEKIRDIYWLFGEQKLYLMKDGKKSSKFSYYYAMYIVDSVMGEDIKGLARLEDDVLKQVKKEFSDIANMMISYDELYYDSDNDVFEYRCVAQKMDYAADIEEREFAIVFERRDEASDKKIWYYGDASFDYVNWHVKFLD